jgi:uncharacterized Ntn-hydrolase superfamily protein
MTWSLIARDADGQFGIAIASRFFAVGALCMHAQAGVGALCTQALMNPLYGPDGLALLAAGHSAAEVVARLTAADAGQAQRQVHVLPAQGAAAAHTGVACVDWCGHRQGTDAQGAAFSVAGNMLAGPGVIEATARAFEASAGQTLAQRLISAMMAGEAAGGDKRGKQSAALRIQGTQPYPALDLRVDDHADPLPELQRLLDVSLQRFQPFIGCLATRDRPAGELDRTAIEARIEDFQRCRQPHP